MVVAAERLGVSMGVRTGFALPTLRPDGSLGDVGAPRVGPLVLDALEVARIVVRRVTVCEMGVLPALLAGVA